VQYATGTLVDVHRLARSAQKVGAFLIVDATQAAGAMRVDTSTLEADTVVTSGYKWLGGHGGVGLAALSEFLLKQFPILPGWMLVRSNPYCVFCRDAGGLLPSTRIDFSVVS
jgi:cysteine desulfurase / selenocysteine lyase